MQTCRECQFCGPTAEKHMEAGVFCHLNPPVPLGLVHQGGALGTWSEVVSCRPAVNSGDRACASFKESTERT